MIEEGTTGAPLLVQLTWLEGDGDLDLNVASSTDPCRSLPRDLDDSNGYGPENITLRGVAGAPVLLWVHAYEAPTGGSAHATIRVLTSDGREVARAVKRLALDETWAPLQVVEVGGALRVELAAPPAPATLRSCIAAPPCRIDVVSVNGDLSRRGIKAGDVVVLRQQMLRGLSADSTQWNLVTTPRLGAVLTVNDDESVSVVANSGGIVEVDTDVFADGRLEQGCSFRFNVALPLSIEVTDTAHPTLHLVAAAAPQWCGSGDCTSETCDAGMNLDGAQVSSLSRRTSQGVNFETVADGRFFVGVTGAGADATGRLFVDDALVRTFSPPRTSAVTPLFAIDIVNGVVAIDDDSAAFDGIGFTDVCEDVSTP